MTRDMIETAVREGVPFRVNMADGKSYEVRDQRRVLVGKAHLVMLDEKLLPHVLPMLTITGLDYLEN